MSESGKKKSNAGRPPILIEKHQLEAICRLNPTLKDCAAYFKCSEDTIDRRAKEFGYSNFADLRDKNMVHTRLSLIRKAVRKAEGGDNTMLIFSLKNLCGWKDKVESEETVKQIQINIDGTDQQL